LGDLPEGAAGIGVVDVLWQDQGLAQNRPLNDYVSLLVADGVFKDPAIEGIIIGCSPHDQRSDLANEPVIIAVSEISCLNWRYNAIAHGVRRELKG
jgi:hypothetical protein